MADEFALMYVLHQGWSDIQEMPEIEVIEQVKRARDQKESERKAIEEEKRRLSVAGRIRRKYGV
jgi:hypothetical protein